MTFSKQVHQLTPYVITEGCTVEFDARVTTYIKGYKGRRDDVFDAPLEMDYKLERPTRVVIRATQALPKPQ